MQSKTTTACQDQDQVQNSRSQDHQKNVIRATLTMVLWNTITELVAHKNLGRTPDCFYAT